MLMVMAMMMEYAVAALSLSLRLSILPFLFSCFHFDFASRLFSTVVWHVCGDVRGDGGGGYSFHKNRLPS